MRAVVARVMETVWRVAAEMGEAKEGVMALEVAQAVTQAAVATQAAAARAAAGRAAVEWAAAALMEAGGWRSGNRGDRK